MHSNSYTLGEAFAHYIVTEQPKGVKEIVAELLRANDLSKIALKKVVRQLGGSLSSFKEELVDLLIFYIEKLGCTPCVRHEVKTHRPGRKKVIAID